VTAPLNERVAVILAVVGAHLGISPAEMRGRRHMKAARYKHARALATYLIRQDVGWSFADIGQAFGDRHHTVMSAYLQGFKPDEAEVQLLRDRITVRTPNLTRDRETNILSEVFALRAEVKALREELRESLRLLFLRPEFGSPDYEAVARRINGMPK